MKTLFVPDWSKGNPYQRLLRKGLESAGVEVSISKVDAGGFSLNRLANEYPEVEIFHIHWIDDLIEHLYWNRNIFFVWAKLLFFALDLVVLRLRGKWVVWTVHNLISHESPDPGIELAARRVLARLANRIFFHSNSARRRVAELYGTDYSKKSAVIEHGNYIGYYEPPASSEAELRDAINIAERDKVILFFGAIRPYKGLEGLVSVFVRNPEKNIRLIIAGKPNSSDLSDAILQYASKDQRIRVELGYVPDRRVAELFSIADIVAVPFENTLTSGSVILAMSMGRALLLPEMARSLDVIDENGAIFYGDEEGLSLTLGDLDRNDLERKGAYNLEVMSFVGWEHIGRLMAAEYSRVCKITEGQSST